MKATSPGLAAIGAAIFLFAACTTAVSPGNGGQPVSTQVLYRSSGFADAESVSSIVLVIEEVRSNVVGAYTLVATLRYNDTPEVDSLWITAKGEETVLRDPHPRTSRRLIGAPRFTTRLTLALDRELVRRLASAQGIVVRHGSERIYLTERERGILQSFLAARSDPD